MLLKTTIARICIHVSHQYWDASVTLVHHYQGHLLINLAILFPQNTYR